MNYGFFRCLGQVGIVIEFLGALFVVVNAFKDKKEVESIDETWRGSLEGVLKLKSIIQGQAKTQRIGFIFIGFGLLLQFIANFK